MEEEFDFSKFNANLFPSLNTLFQNNILQENKQTALLYCTFEKLLIPLSKQCVCLSNNGSNPFCNNIRCTVMFMSTSVC